MATTRLFIGITVPKEIKRNFKNLQSKNKGNNGIRWVNDNNLHITLYFLGDIENAKIDNIIIILTQLLLGKKEFKLKFDRFQLSPKKKPYMIWARFKDEENFTDLSSIMTHIFNTKNSDTKKPIPHITLARFNKKTNIEKINLLNDLSLDEINVEKIILYKSVLDLSGAQYYPLTEYNLTAKK